MLGLDASLSEVSDHAVLVGSVDASSVRSGVSYVSGDSSCSGLLASCLWSCCGMFCCLPGRAERRICALGPCCDLICVS
jgi:hypothetical protein